jgi:DnaJ-class molecular chaperone
LAKISQKNMIEEKPNALDLIPQLYAQKCPVCSGFGTVSFKKITCHACEGKGYILIPIDRKKEYGRNN